jgi:hypothetical protein
MKKELEPGFKLLEEKSQNGAAGASICGSINSLWKESS